jgi:hypothetical protein
MSRDRGKTSAPEAAAPSRELFRLPPSRSGWNIDRWFLALEAQFQLTQVKSDVSKFYAVVANLGERQMELVEDIIIDPPKTGLYECLKAALIKRLFDSDSKRVEKLLEAQDLGDKKPSQLLRDMRKLAGSAFSDDFLTTIWKSRLPVSMRAILSAADVKDVDKLMETADRIHEATAEVNAASTSRTLRSTPSSSRPREQTHGTYEARLAWLERSVRKMRIRDHNQRRRSHSTSRHRKPWPRSKYRTGEQHPGWCYYHQTYQARAKKCRAPCTWNQGNSSSCS